LDIQTKLNRLHERRNGLVTRSGARTTALSSADFATRSYLRENYEQLSEPPSVRYALGSMQPVGKSYTDKSYEEGDRVKARITEGLLGSPPVSFAYQGSVPLDVHIRGSSDVDLLLIHDAFVTHDAESATYITYTPYYGKSAFEELKTLRDQASEILTRRYWGATVKLGSKAIRVSGGSLERDIDVVPAHWHDTASYASSKNQEYRGIKILNGDYGTIHNLPFLHIKKIRERCVQHSGALRKVIRLLKNLKADSENEISLSSYDIAAIVWHMPSELLQVPYFVDLLLVARTKKHLSRITGDETYRDSLWVPDGSRKIFNEQSKVTGLLLLFHELLTLEKKIYKDLDPLIRDDASTTVPESALRRQVVLG
jgi:hypothetical protein